MRNTTSFLFLAIGSTILGFSIADFQEREKQERKIERINERISFLKNEGYSETAAKKITLTEFGILQIDPEYTGLIQD